MNLEIASRLVALRKENNLSQEALAEKLGISRQAVSKWERAEASPDTDNLIALAKLYHVSLDELLKIHEEEENEEPHDSEQKEMLMELQTGAEFGADTENQGEERESGKYEHSGTADVEEDVHVGFDGIHVKDKDAEVHVSWRGIHVHDMKNDNEVHIDKNGIRVNGDEARDHLFTRGKEAELPLGIIAIVVYILIGIFFDLWHPGWLIFFIVPIISTLIHAVRQHNPDLFAYPVLALLVFLYAGLMYSLWHPAWAVFLTIPVYYSVTGYIRRTYTKDVEEERVDRDMQ
ncbi:MAG: helix-turn-helix domain-containing protein [Lachnospiraceae bacterium]|nr:helix-turn-helix domain-containing protein [Lachnospiraceae bacterium]